MMTKTKKQRGYMYILKLLLVGVIFFYILGIVGFAYTLANTYTRSARSSICCTTPADDGLTYENVTLTTNDGLHLYGWYIPSQNGAAVIALHGLGGNRLGSMAHARMLANHGYGVLLYDQRASGESEGEMLSWGWLDVNDVPIAVTYLQNRPEIDSNRIGVIGCSTGAEIAIAAAAQTAAIQAVVADAPYYTVPKDMPAPATTEDWLGLPLYPLFIKFMEWRTGASAAAPLTEVIAKISPRPILLISAGDDFERRQVEHHYKMAEEPKSLWHIPNTPHCGGVTVQPQAYEDHMITFFDQALLK